MKSNDQNGCLWVVATPIGNLGDIGARAVETLQAVDGIICESTQHSKRLLSHCGITTKLIGKITDHQTSEDVAKLLSGLLDGKSYAYVSDAGTPLVSDPGQSVVAYAHKNTIPVKVVPGPSAVTAALSMSGFRATPFNFYGFFPEKGRAQQALLETMDLGEHVQVFFESPHRIEATVAWLAKNLPADRRVCVTRELTKIYEQVWIGSALDLESIWDICRAKGEFTIVIDKAESGEKQEKSSQVQLLEKVIANMAEDGFSSKQVFAALKDTGYLTKNKIYNHFLENQQKRG